MKTLRPITLPNDDRTVVVHITSGAVIRLRPSELVVVSDPKAKRRHQIYLANQIKAGAFQIIGATPRSVNPVRRFSVA
jgi:hypothetical protein